MDIFTPDERAEILRVKSIVKNTVGMKNCILAGGCFASLLNNETVKDYDFFFLKSQELYYNAEVDSIPTDDRRASKDYAINNEAIISATEHKSKSFQFIQTKYETRTDVVNGFDMVHCCVSYNIFCDKLYITRDTFDAIKRKLIIRNRNNKIIPHRVEKMINRGWKVA